MHVRWPSTYEWPQAAKWVTGLRQSLAVKIPFEVTEIVQPYDGAVLIEVMLDGADHLVAIDYFDGDRILDQVLDECSLIFKMQYRAGGYDDPRVVPGGYVPGRRYLYRYLAGLRHLRDSGTRRFDVYGRFSLSYAPEVRRTAVRLLKAQTRFGYEGELALRPYSLYLSEAARSRVCIDLPGNGDMSHRLIDYLAIGCCVVRPEPATRLPTPLTDGVDIRYVAPDLSDLVDACDDLVHDPVAAERMGLAAREYFDRHLHVESLAAHYIDLLLAGLGALAPEHGDAAPADR